MVMSSALVVAALPLFRQTYESALDQPLRLRSAIFSPQAGDGGVQNGCYSSVQGTCAKLAEAKNGTIGALADGLQRVRDQHEMFRRDFLAGPPIDDGGRSYASHAGCFGRATEGVYDIVN